MAKHQINYEISPGAHAIKLPLTFLQFAFVNRVVQAAAREEVKNKNCREEVKTVANYFGIAFEKMQLKTNEIYFAKKAKEKEEALIAANEICSVGSED